DIKHNKFNAKKHIKTKTERFKKVQCWPTLTFIKQ
ncbi:hypothetical protein SEEN185_14444, partial [Salmonella enterica subsp. enterica serovar Newport str. CVM 35185]